MSERMRLARQTPVSAVESLLPIEPLLVRDTEDPVTVLHRAAAQPQTRVLGVVDEGGVLIGVLSIVRLAEAVVVRVAPEVVLAEISDLADAARFGHAVSARTVRDVMLPPISIAPTAPIDEAFRAMHGRHLSGAYVVDADGRPTGYLDLLELTMRYVQAIEAGSSAAD
jgi:CBS domain-containing protein